MVSDEGRMTIAKEAFNIPILRPIKNLSALRGSSIEVLVFEHLERSQGKKNVIYTSYDDDDSSSSKKIGHENNQRAHKKERFDLDMVLT